MDEWKPVKQRHVHTIANVQRLLCICKAGFTSACEWNVNANNTCTQSRGRMYGTFVHCSAFTDAANRPYINILYANSLWCTDSQRIAFDCSPNVCRTAECSLPHLGNTSTSNVRIIFERRIRILFAFWCKPDLRWCMCLVHPSPTHMYNVNLITLKNL